MIFFFFFFIINQTYQNSTHWFFPKNYFSKNYFLRKKVLPANQTSHKGLQSNLLEVKFLFNVNRVSTCYAVLKGALGKGKKMITSPGTGPSWDGRNDEDFEDIYAYQGCGWDQRKKIYWCPKN